jgi:uncharacterized protein YebE (UPF0316 family)
MPPETPAPFEWIGVANKALDRTPRTAYAIGFVTGVLLKSGSKIRPDGTLLGLISNWTDRHREEPMTASQIEDLAYRVHDWIGPTRKRRRRVPHPDGSYR